MITGGVEFKDTGLKALVSFLNSKSDAYVKVGIIGDKSARMKAGMLKSGGGHSKSQKPSMETNAYIGLLMEKGRASHPHIPARSWLLSPLLNGKKEIEKTVFGEIKNSRIGKVFIRHFLRVVGIACGRKIDDAFRDQGPGWAPLSERRIAEKKSSIPLIDTGQLRRAVNFEVVE